MRKNGLMTNEEANEEYRDTLREQEEKEDFYYGLTADEIAELDHGINRYWPEDHGFNPLEDFYDDLAYEVEGQKNSKRKGEVKHNDK